VRRIERRTPGRRAPGRVGPRITPDVSGAWDISYDNDLEVTITLGGVAHSTTLGTAGGVVLIDNNGTPFQFDLNRDRPAISCPSECGPRK
jgi:hypothetical protein